MKNTKLLLTLAVFALVSSLYAQDDDFAKYKERQSRTYNDFKDREKSEYLSFQNYVNNEFATHKSFYHNCKNYLNVEFIEIPLIIIRKKYLAFSFKTL